MPRRRPSSIPRGVRWLTGAAVVTAGGVHLWLWWRGVPVAAPGGVGPAFLLDAGLSALVGGWVLVVGDRRAAWAGSVLSAAALLAYGLARTVGLGGFTETRWTRPSLAAAGCEVLVLVLLLTEALVPDGDGPAKGRPPGQDGCPPPGVQMNSDGGADA